MSANPFSQGQARRGGKESERVTPLGVHEMALDTIASILRILGEYALDQEKVDPVKFAEVSEQWAQHALLASAPPGGEVAGTDARRNWTGIRLPDWSPALVTKALKRVRTLFR